MSVYGPICWERHRAKLFSSTRYSVGSFLERITPDDTVPKKILHHLLVTNYIADCWQWVWVVAVTGWMTDQFPMLDQRVFKYGKPILCSSVVVDRGFVSTMTDSGVSVKAQVSQYPKNLRVCKTSSLKRSQCRRQCFTPASDKSHCLTEKVFAVQPSAKKIRLTVFASVQRSKHTCCARRQQSWPTWADAGRARVPENSAIVHNVRNFLLYLRLSLCSLRTEKAVETAFGLWRETKGLWRKSG